MKTRIYWLINQHEHTHEYTIEESIDADENVKYVLYASGHSDWAESIQNTPLVTLVDDGNGYKLGEKLKGIDYALAEEIRVLLNFINSNSIHSYEYAAFEQVNNIKI